MGGYFASACGQFHCTTLLLTLSAGHSLVACAGMHLLGEGGQQHQSSSSSIQESSSYGCNNTASGGPLLTEESWGCETAYDTAEGPDADSNGVAVDQAPSCCVASQQQQQQQQQLWLKL